MKKQTNKQKAWKGDFIQKMFLKTVDNRPLSNEHNKQIKISKNKDLNNTLY